ncbi:MAG: aspartyl/asparaginyl beta-hydroxylase domain-containing protein [Rhizobacter sp.]|nr:aspartyl/asparaginyl beta-hydroxylase domain-containing protein [Bacteriovorax sp.]
MKTLKIPVHKKIKIPSKIIKGIHNEIMGIETKQFPYPHYLVDGSVKIIPLISPGGKNKNLQGFSNGENFVETKILEHCPEIKKFLESLPGKKFSCRISILEGSSEIHPHRDFFRSIEFGVVRLHLPLQTDKRITFSFGNKNYFLDKGFLHFVDISQVHHLNNPTKIKRIHLIIDLEVTVELIKLLDLSPLQKNLNYLNFTGKKDLYEFKKIDMSLDNLSLPYPLSTSLSSLWKLECIKEKYYFSSKEFRFEVQKSYLNIFSIQSVGPGFFFYFKDKKIEMYCNGIPTITNAGIKNLPCKVKVNCKLGPYKQMKILVRNNGIVEGKTTHGIPYLFNLNKSEDFILLDEQAYKLWKILITPIEEKVVPQLRAFKNSRKRVINDIKVLKKMNVLMEESLYRK